mgnify:CR=1 FL=1
MLQKCKSHKIIDIILQIDFPSLNTFCDSIFSQIVAGILNQDLKNAFYGYLITFT